MDMNGISHFPKLSQDVLKIVIELFSKQPSHVLKQECERFDVMDRSDCNRPPVTLIVRTAINAAVAKGLARRPSRNHIDASKTRVIDTVCIARVHVFEFVCSQRFHCMRVAFD
tara:strand:- start:10459 stop:10797 length:339 start_codon:yes stop_codon:yes gene_type:complete